MHSVGSFDADGKTTAEMQLGATFADWDFNNTWTNCENQSHPRVKKTEFVECFTEQKNYPSDLTTDNRYGISVALTDDTMAVASINHNFPHPNINYSDLTVRIYNKTAAGWVFQTKLEFDPGIAAGHGLVYENIKVLLDEDNLVVAIPYFVDSEPKFMFNIHVVRRNGNSWTEEAFFKYVNDNMFLPYEINYLNSAVNPLKVSLSGDNLAVGIEGLKRINVYHRNTGGQWLLESELNENSAEITRYGSAISLSADTLAAGSPGEGVVYIFKRQGTTWVETSKIVDTLPQFGTAVALDGNTLAVQNGDPDLSFNIYEYTGQSWIKKQKLSFERKTHSDLFSDIDWKFNPWGIVTLKGDTFVASTMTIFNPLVIAPRYHLGSSVVVFKKINGAWQESSYLAKGEPPYSIHLGNDISLNTGDIAVGAPLDEHSGLSWPGAVYLYSLPDVAPSVLSYSLKDPANLNNVVTHPNTLTVFKDRTSVTLEIKTNEPATCKFDTAANKTYATMANTFASRSPDKKTHYQTIIGLTNGSLKSINVLCEDATGHTADKDFHIVFSVAKSTTDTVAPPIPAITATAMSQTKVRLNWAPLSAAEGTAVYRIYQRVDGVNKSYVYVGSTGTPNTYFMHSNLTKGTKYHYKVYVYDLNINFAYSSNEVSVTTLP